MKKDSVNAGLSHFLQEQMREAQSHRGTIWTAAVWSSLRGRCLPRRGNFMLILCTAGNGLFLMLSPRGSGGSGSSFKAGTGEYAEGDPSPRPNELP